jgi:hypothetical protein
MYPDLSGAQGAKGAKGARGAERVHNPEKLTGYIDIITKVGFGVLVVGAATLVCNLPFTPSPPTPNSYSNETTDTRILIHES